MKTRTPSSEPRLSPWWLVVPALVLLVVLALVVRPLTPPPRVTELDPHAPTAIQTTTSRSPFASIDNEAIRSDGREPSDDETPYTWDAREHIPVYLAGEVYEPGVYYVPNGTLLGDVIKKGGGFRETAYTAKINLAMKVKPHRMYFIPSHDDVKASPDMAVIDDDALPAGVTDKIALNRASEDELMDLPGVGPATAAAIVRYRTTHGPFKALSDLKKVPGIKNAKYELIASCVTLDGQ